MADGGRVSRKTVSTPRRVVTEIGPIFGSHLHHGLPTTQKRQAFHEKQTTTGCAARLSAHPVTGTGMLSQRMHRDNGQRFAWNLIAAVSERELRALAARLSRTTVRRPQREGVHPQSPRFPMRGPAPRGCDSPPRGTISTQLCTAVDNRPREPAWSGGQEDRSSGTRTTVRTRPPSAVSDAGFSCVIMSDEACGRNRAAQGFSLPGSREGTRFRESPQKL